MFTLKHVRNQVTKPAGAKLAGAYFVAKRAKKTRTFNPIFEELTGLKMQHREYAEEYHNNRPKFEKEKLLSVFNSVSNETADEVLKAFINAVPAQQEAINGSINKTLEILNGKPERKPELVHAEPENLLFAPDVEERKEEPTPTPFKDAKQELSKKALSEVKANGSLKGMFNFQFPIMEAIEEAIKQYLAANPIKAESSEPKTEIKINNRQPKQIKGIQHKEFKRALGILTATGKLFLAGEAGTGKGTLTKQLAEALGLPAGQISLTAGISEGYLTGRMLINGEFVSTSFIDCYEKGGVFLFDEVDAADSNTLLVVNDALASKELRVPNRTENPIAKRHPDFFPVCAANTWGTGNASIYHGREYLDGAFLDRFAVSKIELDYDKELEEKLSAEAPEVCEEFQRMRENIRANKILRTCSTRAIEDAVKLSLAGFTMPEIKELFFTGWNQQEVNKVA